jgi:murein DD-endopeptidase MepM/ murein hydrolase activator NlpD
MKLGIVVTGGAFVLWFFFFLLPTKKEIILPTNNTPATLSAVPKNTPETPSKKEEDAAEDKSPWQAPIDQAALRVTKKPFGIFITPKNSLVSPERFSGYHTGTDFEFLENEVEPPEFRAVCSGVVTQKRVANGYGGVLVTRCSVAEKTYSVVYGHVALGSIDKKAGDTVGAGEALGRLGKAYSSETDGERGHLHLGVYTKSEASILGYVPSKEALGAWVDACSLFGC